MIEINEKMINLKHTLLNAVPKLKKVKYFGSYVDGVGLTTTIKWQ